MFMKYSFVILLFLSQLSFAQLSLPGLSPEGKIIQQVGFTNFEIRYNRPAARERKIMGDLVVYNKLWRTGASNCTTIAFDKDVVINSKTVPSGIYALLTIPNEKEWTVLLNSDTSRSYGDPSEYNPATEIHRWTVKPEKTNRFYESMTIDLDVVRHNAVFYLSWENTQIHFSIATGANEKAIADIKKALEKEPENPELLSQATYYYYMNHEDSNQALQWITKALSKGEDRWLLRQKFDVLERMKNYDEARKTANTAIAFLKGTKPEAWSEGVQQYEERMKKWNKK
jgi:tetratricopeptide (TPR) repeat protein